MDLPNLYLDHEKKGATGRMMVQEFNKQTRKNLWSKF